MKSAHTREIATEAPGRLLSHYGFESGPTGIRRRRIYVYLPRAYDQDRRKSFPVLYLLDGQNVMTFPAASYGGWKTDLTVERLVEEEAIQPVVVVGVASGSLRLREYMGWSDEPHHHHPSGDKHREYLVEQVLPFVEGEYRISARRPNRVIAGASAGGVAALYTAFRHPELFKGAGVLSAGRHFFPELARRFLLARPPAVRVFLSCGTRGMDRELNPQTRSFCARLKAAGLDYQYVHRARGAHNERSWAAMIPPLLGFFFGRDREGRA